MTLIRLKTPRYIASWALLGNAEDAYRMPEIRAIGAPFTLLEGDCLATPDRGDSPEAPPSAVESFFILYQKGLSDDEVVARSVVVSVSLSVLPLAGCQDNGGADQAKGPGESASAQPGPGANPAGPTPGGGPEAGAKSSPELKAIMKKLGMGPRGPVYGGHRD